MDDLNVNGIFRFFFFFYENIVENPTSSGSGTRSGLYKGSNARQTGFRRHVKNSKQLESPMVIRCGER